MGTGELTVCIRYCIFRIGDTRNLPGIREYSYLERSEERKMGKKKVLGLVYKIKEEERGTR